MLSNQQIIDLKKIFEKANSNQLIWASGFLAGLANGDNNKITTQKDEIKINLKPTIIYGTETGNAKKLAIELSSFLKKNKIQVKLFDAFKYPIEKLKDEELIFFIFSTQGEGEPPVSSKNFMDNLSHLNQNLSHLKFSIFALGDSSYPLFCKTGQDIEDILIKNNAYDISKLYKADVNYKPLFEEWKIEILNFIKTNQKEEKLNKNIFETPITKEKFKGRVKESILLNDIGSNKSTYHIEIACDKDFIYEGGDALGLYPINDENEINTILEYFNLKDPKKELINKNIKGLSNIALKNISKLLDIEIKENKIDLTDIIKLYKPKTKIELNQLLQALFAISPRLYSICSAKEVHENEVHIMVKRDTYNLGNEKKIGFCSSYLTNLAKEQEIEFYLHKNNNFKLPDSSTDIILIGPGTGIAPFRSFLFERDSIGAEGKNWLFFGEQHAVCDFYYQTEILEWYETGTLSKLDVAFSRDGKTKVYVQDKIKEKGKEFVQWIDNGAIIYICGQKSPMSEDVEDAIIEIISIHKNITKEEATSHIEDLIYSNKIIKDVY